MRSTLILMALAAPLFGAGWTDRSEYDLVLNIRAEASPQKQLKLLDEWKAKYPQSGLRQVRRELYLAAYHSLSDNTHMLQVARDMLAEQPDNLVGSYWSVVLIPAAKDPSPELWSLGEKAAQRMLTALPADAEWQKQKNELELLAHRTLAWIQWQRGDYVVAEKEFTTYLEKNPKNGEVTAWYGMALAAQKDKAPEKIGQAVWELMRAGSMKEEGALPDVMRRQVETLAEQVYRSYHGNDEDGLDQLRKNVLASSFAPADYKLESAKDVAYRKQLEELKTTNPLLASWMETRRQLEAADGDKYFETLRATPVRLKGTVIRCSPTERPAAVVLGLSNATTEEVVLNIEPAMSTAAEPGTEIEFEGMAQSVSRSPFSLAITTDPSKITGWPQRVRRR